MTDFISSNRAINVPSNRYRSKQSFLPSAAIRANSPSHACSSSPKRVRPSPAKVSRRQREWMVSSNRSGSVESKINTVRSGGSSSDLSNELAALAFIRSAATSSPTL